MTITPPSDDARWIVRNRPERTAEPVKPTADPRPVDEEKEPANPPRPVVHADSTEPEQDRRRGHDRRLRDRREQRTEVLLDTRENRERRTHDRRSEDRTTRPNSGPSPRRGIDLSS